MLRVRGCSWALVTVVVVVVDQVAKHAIENSVVPGEEHRFLPGVQLVNTRNQGVAFGFLPGKHLGVTILIARRAGGPARVLRAATPHGR